MKRDVEETAKRHFKDPNSFVFKDGREWLEGKDWDARRYELLLRSRGQCEYIYPDQAGNPLHRCTRDGKDPHHKVLRSIRRDDRLKNLLNVCRPHHELLDREQRKQHGKNKVGFKPVGAE